MAKQKFYSVDTETDDPLLITHGPSWVFGQGHIIVTGIYDCQKQKKGFIDGDGGKRVREMLSSASDTLIGANIAYDLGWFAYSHKMRISDIKCGLIDVQVAESLIDEYQPFSLENLAVKYLKEHKGSGTLSALAVKHGLRGDFRKHLAKLWDMGYKDEIRSYVISDADQPARIWEKQKAILIEQGLMEAFMVQMRVLKVTVAMKQRGVRVDYEKWVENCDIAKDAHDKLEKQFFKKWGEVNVNSPKQLGKFMDDNNVPYKVRITIRGWEPEGRKFVVKRDAFVGADITEQRRRLKEDFPSIRIEKDKLKVYVDKKYAERTEAQLARMGYNTTCNPNIDKYFLKDYKATYQVVADLVEYKQVKGIISKFLGPNFGRFLVWHPRTKEWRLHGNFNVVGARQTSRMSSNNPNLQNIPSKTKLFEGTDYEIDLATMCREIFLPEKGGIFVKLDFNGQENRLQAHFAVGRSGRQIRLMYNENPRLDEHQFVATASGLEDEYGKKTGRKYAKNVRFGLSYGMQIARMCLQFGWEKEFAEALADKVKDASPWFIETMEVVKETVAARGYIKTLGGRRVHLKQFDPRASERERQFWKTYPFYNYLIQGSAADQMKACIVAMDDTTACETLLLFVHDEADLSLPMTKEGLNRLKELQAIMQETVRLEVPVLCDPELGSDWAHLEGQAMFTEDCDPSKVGWPSESLAHLWTRMSKVVKAGVKAKERVYDVVEENDDLLDDDMEEDEE